MGGAGGGSVGVDGDTSSGWCGKGERVLTPVIGGRGCYSLKVDGVDPTCMLSCLRSWRWVVAL